MGIEFASTEPLNPLLRTILDQPCADIRSLLRTHTCRASWLRVCYDLVRSLLQLYDS
jgi:hypothetical protein